MKLYNASDIVMIIKQETVYTDALMLHLIL